MLDSSDQQRLHKLLSDTIPLLCKRTLGYNSELSVEAFIGITLLDEYASKEVVVVSFKETLLADGHVSSYVWSEVPPTSSGLSPTDVEPVAFIASESGSCDQSFSPTGDSIDGNDSGLERHGEYDPNWEDGRYWAECDNGVINNGAADMSTNGAKSATEASTSSNLLPFPVKMEENYDNIRTEDKPKNFERNVDFESTSNLGNSCENPYTAVARHSLPAAHSHGNVSTHQHRLSAVGQRLTKGNKGSRKIIHQPGSAQSLSPWHLPLSAYSKARAKVKKATYPTVTMAMHSNHSEQVVENGKDKPSLPQYTMPDGLHTSMLIAPTPMQATPKKRCRVCYAAKKRREVRYCCGTCPERPGLCLEPCFREFHRSMITVTAPAFIFSGVEPDEAGKSLQLPHSAH